MSAKRGRPLSGESDNAAVNRRREQVRERVRKFRERQPRQPATPTSVAQQEQGEIVINLPSIEEQEVAATLLSLGVRHSPDLQLPQDQFDAKFQQRAIHVDEHTSLYPERRQDNLQETQPSRRFFFRFTFPKGQEPESTITHQSPPPPPPPAVEGDAAATFPAQLSVSQSCDEFVPFAIDSSPQPSSREHSNDRDLSTGDAIEPERAASDGVEIGEVEAVQHVLSNIEQPQSGLDEPIEDNVAALAPGSEDVLGSEQLRLVSDDDDDDESVISFVSEREVDEEKEAAYEYTANKLLTQFHGGHQGCSQEQHEDKLREHMAEAGTNHHGLSEVFRDRRFPSVLALEGLLTPEQLAQERAPSAAQWEAMFCGVPARGSQRFPKNICLHKEQTQGVEPQVAYDVDSFLGFWTTLAAAKQGIQYQAASTSQQNLQTDVHLETNMFTSGGDDDQPVRASLRMLRDVPHFRLGRVFGATNITVHILFPHLPLAPGRDRFISMTQAQLARWTDRVMHPAIWRFYPAYHTQHLPATYTDAWMASKAHQVEGRKVETASYQSQRAIVHHIRPEYLQGVWEAVLEIIRDTPGLADFREPQLFFNAKGTKMSFQSLPVKPTLLDVMEHFESYLEPVMDLRLVDLDRFYVDVGKEICPHVSLLPGQDAHREQEAQVYSWKRCCLEEYMQWMYDGKPPSNKAQGQRYYHQNMLFEASSLTSVTPKLSQLRRGGLIYSQFYGSVKEITDAYKCKPFENDGMEEMALDPQIRRGAQSIAGGHRRETRIITQAYLESKKRAQGALRRSKGRSFGIREEHRITWELFQRLKMSLEAHDRSQLEVTLPDCPSYAWPVRTEVYLDFLWRSADKFATGFEVVRARCGREMVPWGSTTMMIAFLRCLRFVMGGNQLRQEPALWWSKRTFDEDATQPRVWYGLGFCNTLARYKYCWLEPWVDWERLQFRPEVSDRVLFGNGVLRGEYLRRGRQVRGFMDLALALEVAMEWLEEHRHNEVICRRVLSWMVHICLRQFRVDVLQAVKAEIREEHREEAIKGDRPFSREYFEEIMADGCFLISGNKTEMKDPKDLAHFLFDYNDGRTREHWEDRPFRKLYQRARSGLGARVREWRTEFSQRFWTCLFEYHWVWPYPCYNALLQTTKAPRRRMWYSVGVNATTKQWVWKQKKWTPGEPAQLPAYLQWKREEWERWMEERRSNGGETQAERSGGEGGVRDRATAEL